MENNVFGLTNYGNTCYFNSLIQAMAGCTIFTNYIKSSGHNILNNAFNGINHRDLLNELRKTNNFYNQECANEVFLALLEYMCKNTNKAAINNIFSLTYRTRIYCKICEELNSGENELFTYFTYIPGDTGLDSIVSPIESYIFNNHSHLDDVKCDNGHINETYIINIVNHIPRVIVVTIGKYYNKSLLNFNQIIQFKNHTFELVSIIDHSGSRESGHYVCRSTRNKKKYMFNDSYITSSNLNPTESSYMLFYQLIDEESSE